MNFKKDALTKLDKITTTIVYYLEEVGLYQYNKLAYLFEYYYIVNFGQRYSGEKFIRLPHGPVIKNYKQQICKLSSEGLLAVNCEAVNKTRKVDEGHTRIPIRSTEDTKNCIIDNRIILKFLDQLLKKFGPMDQAELEKAVYSTQPMKNYLERVEFTKKKELGGYVLKDCIKIKEHKTPQSIGRKLALEHLEKYPKIDWELQRKFAEEFADLVYLRP